MRKQWAFGLWMILFLCVTGFIGLSATDASAVVKNQINMASADAKALVGSEIEIAFTDGTIESTIIQDDGSFTTSKPVTERNVHRCSVVKKTPSGEEKRVLPSCAWLLGGSGAAGMTVRSEPSLLYRLLDSEFVIQGGYSETNGINSTSRGAFPGGATFLDGSGANDISAPSYNFMLQHPFDRFRQMLGGGAPYVFLQGSKFHGLDADGGAGVSGTGLDQTSLNREISAAFGGGIGFSYPLYCYDGIRGGDKCFEIGAFVGGKGVRQRVSATADEAGNLKSFQDCYTDVVPFGGLTAAAPLFPGVKFVFTYEIIALYSKDLRGTSFFNNTYDYKSDGGTLHNLWGGVSINPGKLLNLSPRWTF